MTGNVICPLLLAAGQSSRFGSDKLLHTLDISNVKQALILHSIKPWLEVFDKLTVVIRPDNSGLKQLLKNSAMASQITLIEAEHASNGMSASLIAGISAHKSADGWLIGLADMPFVESAVIRRVFESMMAGSHIALPVFDGKRGHPVGFSSFFLDELLSLRGDNGARGIIAKSPEKITQIECANNGIWRDIDTLKSI